MSNESHIEANTELKSYHSPILSDFGKMSELTQAITGDTGDDGGLVPSSYTGSS